MILMIDNYDSFTYNLVQYLSEFGERLIIRRNDEITLEEIREVDPDYIVISPGPGRPKDAGISNDIIRYFGASIPVLGVCLGHQCIAEVYGGRVVRAKRLMHGKTSPVYHNKKGIFKGLPVPFEATRYHSLIVEKKGLPAVLDVIAWTDRGEIMALKHKRFPVWGVQFHPESILTGEGKRLLKNFISR